MLHSRTVPTFIASIIIALQAISAAQAEPAKADPAQAKPVQSDTVKADLANPAPMTTATQAPTQPAASAKQDCCPECNCEMPMIDPDP
jgi:hypothetical protein